MNQYALRLNFKEDRCDDISNNYKGTTQMKITNLTKTLLNNNWILVYILSYIWGEVPFSVRKNSLREKEGLMHILRKSRRRWQRVDYKKVKGMFGVKERNKT